VKDETTIIQERDPDATLITPPPPEAPRAVAPDRLRGPRRQRGPLGLAEIVALASSALLLLAALGSYFLILRPQRVRAEGLEAERAQLERQLQITRSSVTEGKDTQTSVRDILGSLRRFEIEHLGHGVSGSTNTMKELHRLMLKNGLRISGGMAYTQLEETLPGAEKKQQPREAGAGRVVQSAFPGIGITMTVEGLYPNLRRFIREVEASPQFIVINAVELEGVTDGGNATEGPPVATGAAGVTTTGARGTLVSLRLDMAAYFRRANVAGDLIPPASTDGTTAR
jgi:hypothetical protein